MSSPISILVLDKDDKSFHIVNDIITSIENNVFQVDWILITNFKKVSFEKYQFYIVNATLWVENNIEQGQQLATLQQHLNPLISEISPAPVILLTEDSRLGIAALDWGIVDYWDIQNLNLSIIERALRLILKNAQLQQQLTAKENYIQFFEKNQSLETSDLQEWKNRYEAAIETSGHIFYEWNSQTNQILWRGKLEKILGYSQDEVINNLDWWIQLIHPEDRLKFAVAIEQINETRESADLDYRVKRKDGNYILVKDKGNFFIDNQGKRVQRIGLIKNITEQQKAEATIRKQEQEFKALVENVPNLIIRLDKNQRYLYVNPMVEQESGIPAAKIIGKTPRDLGLPDELVRLWTQTHQEVFETGEERLIKYEYPSLTGTTYWQSQVVPEINKEGIIETILVIGRNITKQRQAEEALRKNEEQLRLVIDALPICIAYTDAEQRYQFINKNYEHWFGQKKEEIFGKTLQEVLGQKAYQIVRPNVERVLKGEPVTYETTLPYQKGGSRHVLGNLIPDVGENAQIKGYYALITDISERKQAEEKLRYRLVLETAISLVSKELATYEQVDLRRVLQILGLAVKANRAYLLRFYQGATKATMTHEWCDSLTQPKIAQFQNIDLSTSPWWIRQLQQHKKIIHGSIDILLAATNFEQASSGLGIPIYNQFGKLWGQIGFDSTEQKPKIWPEEDEQLLRVVGDIIYRYHERIIAQEQLRSSQSLYSSIFNHCADAIFLVKVLPDGDFVYETVNPAYEQTSGLFLEQIVGKTPRNIFPINTAIPIEQWYRNCVKFRETLYFEEILELPVGQRIWRTNLVPIADGQGKIITIQGSSRDITEERKAVDEQIRHAKFHRLLASLTIKIRQSLEIEEILQTAVREIQSTLETDRVIFLKINSSGTSTVIHESVKSDFPSLLNQVYKDECFVRHYQTLHDFGDIKYCFNVSTAGFQPCYQEFLQQAQIQSYVIFPIIIEQFSLQSTTPLLWGLLCVQHCSNPREWTANEINLLKQVSEQLNIALKQAQLRQQEITKTQELARSNHDLEQFAYSVSHDLQEPLGIIASYGQLLKRHCQGQLDAKAEKYIEQMLKSVQRMRQQIEDLLQYSRVGTCKQTHQLIDCHFIIQQAITNLEVSIRKKQAIITIITPLPTFKVNASLLIQLWQNLISNAIKYHSDRPPIIKIACQRQQEEWLFSISDNGIGIEEQYSERIFQIFQRLHTQEEYPGTGIGLAICQRIVQRHGGRIWVESKLGKGATFYFTIPEQTTVLQDS